MHCDMEANCKAPVTHVDHKGYVYCESHGKRRRASGIACRKLRPAEVKQLEAGQTIRYR
jgi:hypothetical protein